MASEKETTRDPPNGKTPEIVPASKGAAKAKVKTKPTTGPLGERHVGQGTWKPPSVVHLVIGDGEAPISCHDVPEGLDADQHGDARRIQGVDAKK